MNVKFQTQNFKLFVVSNATLRGADTLQAAQVLQWLSWADSEILPASCAWVFPTIGIMESDPKVCVFGNI